VERGLVRAVARLEVGGGTSAAGLLVLGHGCVLLSSRTRTAPRTRASTLRRIGCDRTGFRTVSGRGHSCDG
jgi:hypothetical protein